MELSGRSCLGCRSVWILDSLSEGPRNLDQTSLSRRPLQDCLTIYCQRRHGQSKPGPACVLIACRKRFRSILDTMYVNVQRNMFFSLFLMSISDLIAVSQSTCLSRLTRAMHSHLLSTSTLVVFFFHSVEVTANFFPLLLRQSLSPVRFRQSIRLINQ